MKFFDPHAALAKIVIQAGTPATSATSATRTRGKPLHVAKVADVAAPEGEIQKTTLDDMSHGFVLNGHPKTWTGKIVSLQEWRDLSQWERHGSTGQFWNGLTQDWEPKI